MRVATLVDLAQRGRLPPLQRKVLSHLEAHSDEVFEYRDPQLAKEVSGKASSVGFSLWALHKKRLIDKQEVAGRMYFGSMEAVATLRDKLGIPAGDPFERANRNLYELRAKVGTIDVQALLDEVRDEVREDN